MYQMCQGAASGAYDKTIQQHICYVHVVVLNKSRILLAFSL